LAGSGSRQGHSAVLERLVDHGLVLAEPANLGSLYRFNRDHLLAPAVVLAVGLRSELLTRLGDETAQLNPVPVHASVFGSFARGEAGVDSDIDVLLIAASDADTARWEGQVDGLEDRVRRWTGNRCRCLVVTVARAQQLSKQNEPIVSNWIDDGVLLGGERLKGLLAMTANRGSKRRRSSQAAVKR